MTASYRSIDYRVRPAKHAERLMMCDAFRRLRFGAIESYQYVGLGSVYFSDFSLFHRALGISSMKSIEREEHDRTRFEANLPFTNIDMMWGDTACQLPLINLDLRTIIWLDYDGSLDSAILDDLRSVVSRIATGSVLIVTVQCQPYRFDATDSKKAVTELALKLGSDRVDPQLDDSSLQGWGTAHVFYRVIIEEIERTLISRNGVVPARQHMKYQQIFHFHYQDGARMLTTGGVFFDAGQASLFDLCGFSDLPFTRTGAEAFRIDIPKLTLREIKRLDAQMPKGPGEPVQYGPIPPSDAEMFVRIYRYFPMFLPTEL